MVGGLCGGQPAACRAGQPATPWATHLPRPPGGGSSRQASLEMPLDESCSGGFLASQAAAARPRAAMAMHGLQGGVLTATAMCACPLRCLVAPRDGGHGGALQCRAVPVNDRRRYQMTPLHGGISVRHGHKVGRGMANAGMPLRVPWEPCIDTELDGDPLARQHD